MESSRRLIDYYLPPAEGFVLESLVATTYEIDFEFLEEELLAAALGVRSPASRLKAFRSELERRLQKTDVSVLYDLRTCDRLNRLSPRIDPVPATGGKLHSKMSLLMWTRESPARDAPPDRRMRVIVGSANLTRQGFRNNYECVASMDFGGRNSTPRSLLTSAIAFVQQIAAASTTPQLTRQLAAFSRHAAMLSPGTVGADDPISLVAAEGVVPAIRDAWAGLSDKAPERVTVVSPFWAEGVTASDGLFDLFQSLGDSADFELVCRGEMASDGKRWLPVFDGDIALALTKRLSGRLFLRAALPDTGVQQPTSETQEIGDELEDAEIAARTGRSYGGGTEVQRALHAKMILLNGVKGSVLYAGSSNCTRRGLALGGPRNFEAGVVYRLTPRHRKQIAGLLDFAGPPSEVRPDAVPPTISPSPDEEVVVPTFISEVVAAGTQLTIRFRGDVPADLVLLMPIPAKGDSEGRYWLLYQGRGEALPVADAVVVDIATCQQCDEQVRPVTVMADGQPLLPHVFVEVRWDGHSASFPVRFDDKAALPLLLVGRKPSEGEIIEYFLFGREPNEWDGESGVPGGDATMHAVDDPIDTRGILAYFIRRFVQALPGMEAEIRRAAYSRPSLEAALRGPTSPLELAERALTSLCTPPQCHEPCKTPTAVGFQLTEILAAVLRCRSEITDPELCDCFTPVIARCQQMLDTLISDHCDLQTGGFRLYCASILDGAQ